MTHTRLELQVANIASHACFQEVRRVSTLMQRAYGNPPLPVGRVVTLETTVPLFAGGPPARRYLRMRDAGEELGRRAVAEIGEGRVVYELPPRAVQRGRVVVLTWRCVVR